MALSRANNSHHRFAWSFDDQAANSVVDMAVPPAPSNLVEIRGRQRKPTESYRLDRVT